MLTTIDRAGRVVIPASLRARAGFTPGMTLEVQLDDTGIRLVPVVPGPKLERVGKRLIARPTVPARARTKIDVAKLVEEERNRWP